MKIVFGLVFVALVVVFTILSGPLYRDAIESDLAHKVATVLDEEGVDAPAAEVDHLHVGFAGRFGSESAAEKAARAATRVWGAYAPDPGDLRVGDVMPAVFSAREIGSVLVLGGTLPDEAWCGRFSRAAAAIEGVTSVDDRNFEIDAAVSEPAWADAVIELMRAVVPKAENALLTARAGKLTLAGEIGSAEQRAVLIRSAAATGLEPVDRLRLTTWREPSAEFARRGGRLEVSGLFGSASAQRLVLDAAREAADGAQVKNSTRVERSVREAPWAEHLALFVPAFVSGCIGDVSVRYAGGKLTAEGSAYGEADVARLESLAGQGDVGIPASVVVELVAPPGSELVVRREGGAIVLAGEVGDALHRSAIEEEFRAVHPDTPITNLLQIANAPRGEITSAGAIARALPQLTGGVEGARITAAPGRVEIAGRVLSEVERSRIGAAVSALLPDPGSLENHLVAVLPPGGDPAALVTKLKSLAVYFESSSARVSKDGEAKIAEIAALLNSEDGGAVMTVGGFADLRGDARANRELSLRRAQAVCDRLVDLGVPAERMNVRHFGEDTSRTERSELWKSRRVELSFDLRAPE